MTVVSFPGLGIAERTIDRVAFTVGGVSVYWYGIILTLGIVAGFFYVTYRAKFEGFTTDDVIDYAIVTVFLAIIGARTYYVLTTIKDGLYDSFLDVIAIWQGGIAIYGAIIGGACGLLVVSHFKKVKGKRVLKVFDMVSPAVMLGQIIGRWGNFVNGEAHGVKTAEDFIFRMGLGSGNRQVFYHPTFLYESVWNLVGFVLINIFYKKKKYDGQIMLMYLGWYGLGRMFIEGLRTDSLYIGAFRISQVVGFLCFVICTTLLIYFAVKSKRQELDREAYSTVYDKLKGARRLSAEKEQARAEGESDVEAIIARAREKKKDECNDKAD